jgi:adenosylhomocysteinase
VPVFAVKGESLEEYWDYTDKIFQWADGGLTNMILDDGGDATMYILIGARVEAGEKPRSSRSRNPKKRNLLGRKQIKKRMKRNRPAGSPNSAPPSRA